MSAPDLSPVLMRHIVAKCKTHDSQYLERVAQELRAARIEFSAELDRLDQVDADHWRNEASRRYQALKDQSLPPFERLLGRIEFEMADTLREAHHALLPVDYDPMHADMVHHYRTRAGKPWDRS